MRVEKTRSAVIWRGSEFPARCDHLPFIGHLARFVQPWHLRPHAHNNTRLDTLYRTPMHLGRQKSLGRLSVAGDGCLSPVTAVCLTPPCPPGRATGAPFVDAPALSSRPPRRHADVRTLRYSPTDREHPVPGVYSCRAPLRSAPASRRPPDRLTRYRIDAATCRRPARRRGSDGADGGGDGGSARRPQAGGEGRGPDRTRVPRCAVMLPSGGNAGTGGVLVPRVAGERGGRRPADSQSGGFGALILSETGNIPRHHTSDASAGVKSVQSRQHWLRPRFIERVPNLHSSSRTLTSL